MNFIGRHNHLGGYRRVENGHGFVIPFWVKQESPTYTKPSYSWRKGTLINSTNAWLQIKIGGDEITKKKKCQKQANRIKSTKYSLLTFLPQNLLEQFRRIANFYFLVMTIISLLIDSPVTPMTSLLPLVFVIAVTAAKQGYEDYLRYKTDNIVNCSPVTVIRNGQETNIECQDVRPGDLVLVTRDCDVPCDLVLLKSSDPHGKCFITTANLDGESNLKILTVPRGLPDVGLPKLHKLGTIECEYPKTDLYSFNGKIMLSAMETTAQYLSSLEETPNSNILPLTAENVLLRGSRVKNTECVIGCAVYTGMTTKLALNSRLTRVKAASSEIFINRFLIFILIGLIAIVSILYFFKRYYELFVIEHHAYVGPPINTNTVKAFLQDYLSFLILFNYLIPISLYVTIEMHRVVGGFFMEWDPLLYDEEKDYPCIVNTSNLNEELGQINILFSDKTGTLTKNEMIFQQCSINGRKYNYKKTRLQEEASQIEFDINRFNEDHKTFFQALSVCHTIQVAGKIADDANKDGDENDNTAKIYSFADITEESHNSSQQSDVDSGPISSNPSGKLNGLSDANPLLTETKQKRPEIVKRSPRFARPPSRVHPADVNGEFIDRPITYPTSLQSLPNGRPSSLHFNRSVSNLEDLADRASYQTHRRTQSYGAPGTFTRQAVGSFIGLKRTGSSISSRESYASPNFVQQPSPLLRAESQRRKNEIQSVVEALDYQASSPDEKALVEACAHLGLVYLGDDDEILKVRVVPPHMDYSRPNSIVQCNELNFKRLHVLEFTSDRKRMSVIVRDENGDRWIYTKGAESYVFPLCASSSSSLIDKTDRHISDFARSGLRTLAVARKRLSEQEYRDFAADLSVANNALENRKQLSEECYAKIERQLDLLGATAVEDALQDDVADTLVSLQKAGIRIWVLTGDKIETALNIALSCGHIPAGAVKYFIVECSKKEDMEVHLDTLEREIKFGCGRPCALLVDGKSLTIALKDTPERFREVTINCQAVLCCRLSPLQKSEVVALIKSGPQTYITAAIGDGANDVSMIQEAHVGLGIMGKEGRQAARCADFAFANFSMLKRLLLVHGHYHTNRLSFLVLYFFYKNIIFMTCMFLFQFHTMFSTSPVYDSLFLTLYNVMYTSLPVLFISLTEKPYSEKVLMSDPKLYTTNTNNKPLHWKFFLSWVICGIYHALVCFYFLFYDIKYNNVLLNAGQIADQTCFGTFLMQSIVIVVNLKLWLEAIYQSYIFIATIWFSIFCFVVTTIIYTVLDFRYDTDMYWTYINVLSSLPFWLLTFVVIVACLIPDYSIKMMNKALSMPKRSIFPGKNRLKMFQKNNKSETTYL